MKFFLCLETKPDSALHTTDVACLWSILKTTESWPEPLNLCSSTCLSFCYRSYLRRPTSGLPLRFSWSNWQRLEEHKQRKNIFWNWQSSIIFPTSFLLFNSPLIALCLIIPSFQSHTLTKHSFSRFKRDLTNHHTSSDEDYSGGAQTRTLHTPWPTDQAVDDTPCKYHYAPTELRTPAKREDALYATQLSTRDSISDVFWSHVQTLETHTTAYAGNIHVNPVHFVRCACWYTQAGRIDPPFGGARASRCDIRGHLCRSQRHYSARDGCWHHANERAYARLLP